MIPLSIHHIGYLVKKMAPAIEQFQKLGYQIIQEPVLDTIRQVTITFLSKDDYVIELVQPENETSVVASLLKKYKNSPYHICYSSEHFSEDVKMLTDTGYLAIDIPTTAPACKGHNVQFFIHPNLGMIEIMDMHS